MQARAAYLSPGQTKDQQERLVQPFSCFRVDAANHPPNPVTAKCHKFVRHDL